MINKWAAYNKRFSEMAAEVITQAARFGKPSVAVQAECSFDSAISSILAPIIYMPGLPECTK